MSGTWVNLLSACDGIISEHMLPAAAICLITNKCATYCNSESKQPLRSLQNMCILIEDPQEFLRHSCHVWNDDVAPPVLPFFPLLCCSLQILLVFGWAPVWVDFLEVLLSTPGEPMVQLRVCLYSCQLYLKYCQQYLGLSQVTAEALSWLFLTVSTTSLAGIRSEVTS